jgi:hypothetical protein
LAVLACAAGEAAETKVHQEGRIRVIYQTEGRDAVRPDDGNRNGIPDQVEDVLTQTVAARRLFVEVLGFPDPLQTERFRTASYLDIRFKGKDTGIRNGTAFDELQRSRGVPGDPTGTLCIAFCVVATLDPKTNVTPAHEYFHLIQYGVSYFKNKWYAEGTARWSERGLAAGALGPAKPLEAWPLPSDKASELFAMSYDAATAFWNPLAARCDACAALPDGPALEQLQAMTYTDGSPVLKDLHFAGWRFVRDVLLELGEADDIAYRELNHDRWSEANQFSPKNDVYILRAVEKVVARHGCDFKGNVR